jgi:hypothetical protein
MIRCRKLKFKTCIKLLQISGFIELELPYSHIPPIEIETREYVIKIAILTADGVD